MAVDSSSLLLSLEAIQEFDRRLEAQVNFSVSRQPPDSIVPRSRQTSGTWTKINFGVEAEIPSLEGLHLLLDPDTLPAEAELTSTAFGLGSNIANGSIYTDSAAALLLEANLVASTFQNQVPALNPGLPASITHSDLSFELTGAVALPRYKNGHTVLLAPSAEITVNSISDSLFFPTEHTFAWVMRPIDVVSNALKAVYVRSGTRYFVNSQEISGDDGLLRPIDPVSLTIPYRGEVWGIYVIRRTLDGYTVKRYFEDGIQDSYLIDSFPFDSAREARSLPVSWYFAQHQGLYGDIMAYSRALSDVQIDELVAYLRQRWLEPQQSQLSSVPYHVSLTPIGGPKPTLVARDRLGFTVASSDFSFAVCQDTSVVSQGTVLGGNLQ